MRAGQDMPAGVDAPIAADPPAAARWFMDYRNADGSVAEMCGNGIRVFVRYLLETGLAAGDELVIATRGGPRRVLVRPDGGISVDMGAATIVGPGRATVGGRICQGLRISVGNPHLACIVDTSDTPGTSLDEFDLSGPPELDPGQFPAGGNVELIEVTGHAAVRMRVRERGSGETRSCGTGAVAAAVAAAYLAAGGGGAAPGQWRVDVPGGQLAVTLDGRTSWLTGPAVIVAEGELRDAWLCAAERTG
jgi:diaminopimelate epimerase